MSQNKSNASFQRTKFTFTGQNRYIVMDINKRVALADLKFAFAKILNLDFYCKQLKYRIKNGDTEEELKSFQSLEEQNEKWNRQEQKNNQLEINVDFDDEGA
ncbi:hypothetical protein PPERSA_04990 [Pseudocohnilembus persalinus]|uniref:PB1 domain-containing protein n=1 Tax=Pseudocohnilembus persalinus TaxID=266149 RepID=A0A0V0QVH9_PSEPJ|nr:hypothetical protein PPERSA_04990 [Pseudocohnilembus persalinus]|eukprot:KRX06377.1 hypothetical protein PPERSA_04990 [Pseudocohnilembus persalinus]